MIAPPALHCLTFSTCPYQPLLSTIHKPCPTEPRIPTVNLGPTIDNMEGAETLGSSICPLPSAKRPRLPTWFKQRCLPKSKYTYPDTEPLLQEKYHGEDTCLRENASPSNKHQRLILPCRKHNKWFYVSKQNTLRGVNGSSDERSRTEKDSGWAEGTTEWSDAVGRCRWS